MYTIEKINAILKSLTDRLSKWMCLAGLVMLFIPVNLPHFTAQSAQALNLPNIYQPQTEKLRLDGSDPQRPAYGDSRLQIAKLIASDGSASDLFGYSIAISGKTVVVGAYFDDDETVGGDAGSVYVFERSGSDWGSVTQVAKLTPSDAQASEFFGASVSISGDTIVVGAYGSDVGSNSNQGAAYIFVRPISGWADSYETAKLTASDGSGDDRFGYSVSISADTVVVGAYWDDTSGINNHGSAYVFTRPESGWADMQETAKLNASDKAAGDLFGISVSIFADTIVVGANGDDDRGSDSGSAYVFVKPALGWTTAIETAKLTASDTTDGDEFGKSVAIFDNAIVVGAPDPDSDSSPGYAYVFIRPDTGWVNSSQTAKLSASDGGGGDRFGIAVSISDDTIVVGASKDDAPVVDQGSAYIYLKPVGGWIDGTEISKIYANDGNNSDQFGISVSISGDTIAVGANMDDISTNADQGSAYIFQNGFCSKSSGTWSDTNTWVGDVVPQSGDNACIDFGHTVTLGSDADINRLLINPGAELNASNYDLSIEGSMINNGTLRQTKPVNNASVEFLHFQNAAYTTTKYRGLDINTTKSGANLGLVEASIRETVEWISPASDYQYCTNDVGDSPVYTERCFKIVPATNGSAELRLWNLASELNNIGQGDLSIFHNTGGAWVELQTNRAIGDDGGMYSFAEADTPSFSSFLIGQTGNNPTNITVEGIKSEEFSRPVIVSLILGLALFCMIIAWYWRKSRSRYVGHAK